MTLTRLESAYFIQEIKKGKPSWKHFITQPPSWKLDFIARPAPLFCGSPRVR